MKKLFFFAALLAATICATAQQNQVVWQNGKVLFANPIATIDSLTFSNNAEELDTLYMLLPRTIVRVDTVYIHDTVYQCPPNPDAPLAGVFSVSATQQVKFSKGNLQYTQSTNTWSFAANQYDMIGTANVKNNALANKIDLFGWSGSVASSQWGVSTSTSSNEYMGTFADWGQNIGDGTTWRTLTNEEWTYLLSGRANASSLMGVARIQISEVKYANGLILLPDTWNCPNGVTFTPGFLSDSEQDYAVYQTFTLEQWSKLEAAGAVLLPAAGHRYGTAINSVQEGGFYWSADFYNSNLAYCIYFFSNEAIGNQNLRFLGNSVRLVQDL